MAKVELNILTLDLDTLSMANGGDDVWNAMFVIIG